MERDERIKKSISETRKQVALQRHKEKPFSETTKKKIGLANKGSNSGNWKRDKVGYKAIHMWVNKWKPKPPVCQKCGRADASLEAANIDHKYRRILDDYIYVCRKCHRQMDKELVR